MISDASAGTGFRIAAFTFIFHSHGFNDHRQQQGPWGFAGPGYDHGEAKQMGLKNRA